MYTHLYALLLKHQPLLGQPTVQLRPLLLEHVCRVLREEEEEEISNLGIDRDIEEYTQIYVYIYMYIYIYTHTHTHTHLPAVSEVPSHSKSSPEPRPTRSVACGKEWVVKDKCEKGGKRERER